MILTAGLTPAWQQIVRLENFRPGEVNRAVETHWCASGKVLNVAVALAQLQVPSAAVSLLGSPELLEPGLAQLGVKGTWIATQSPTRICTTILDAATKSATELVENAGPVTAAEVSALQQAFGKLAGDAAVVVLIGSLPPGAPATLFRDLLQQAKGKAIVDARGPELVAALACKPLLVKPNREELAATVGRPCDSDLELHDAMQELIGQGAQWVLVTSGARDVWLMSAGELHRFTPLDVTVVNPIGSGDCLAAGIAAALHRGDAMPEAVRYGLAAAADNAAQLLPARLDAGRVKGLAANVKSERCP